MAGVDFEVCGSRPGSSLSNYSGVSSPPPNAFHNEKTNKQRHYTYADRLFGKIDHARKVSANSPSKAGNTTKQTGNGPLKATKKFNETYVDETLFGKPTEQSTFDAPWSTPEPKPHAFAATDYKKTPRKSPSPRPTSGRKNSYKTKHEPSYVDETLFGSSNPFTTAFSALEIDNNRAKLTPEGGADSARPGSAQGTYSHRPGSARFKVENTRPPSRTNIGDDVNVGSLKTVHNGRITSGKKRFKDTFVDDTLFGPKLEEPSFPAPWEKPEDRNKPRPYFTDPSSRTVTIKHDTPKKDEQKRKVRPSSGSLSSRPVWK